LAGLLDLTSEITTLMTGVIIGATMTAALISTMTTMTAATIIMIGIGQMTLQGGRAATD
jgi:hypothetical protein